MVFQPSFSGKEALTAKLSRGVTGLSAHSSRSLGCNVSALDGPMIYPLVNIQKAIENGHRNSGFSREKKSEFP